MVASKKIKYVMKNRHNVKPGIPVNGNVSSSLRYIDSKKNQLRKNMYVKYKGKKFTLHKSKPMKVNGKYKPFIWIYDNTQEAICVESSKVTIVKDNFGPVINRRPYKNMLKAKNISDSSSEEDDIDSLSEEDNSDPSSEEDELTDEDIVSVVNKKKNKQTATDMFKHITLRFQIPK